MKAPSVISLLIQLCGSVLLADLDIREITPEKAEPAGWKIIAQEKDNSVLFKVQPPKELLFEHSAAHFAVWNKQELIATSLLGPIKYRGESWYQFAVSKRYLDGSDFEFCPNPPNDLFQNTTFHFHLKKFIDQKPKTSER